MAQRGKERRTKSVADFPFARPQNGSSGSGVSDTALLPLRSPSLALMRVLAVMLLCLYHKLMQAMTERDACYTLSGKVQVDDAYLGGERSGGKVGRGSENKVAFVAAVSVSDEGHPMRIKLNTVSGFKLKAIAAWASQNLAPGSTVYSDGLACFSAVRKAGCTHERTVVGGRKPKEVLQLQWINTVLGNLKSSSQETKFLS